VPETIEFRSPAGGFVIEKTAVQGLHVTAGQSLYKVVDLSFVWVEADLYEFDLGAARVGQAARVTFDAYPGRDFAGRLVYVYPYLNEATRTNRVRIELPNPDGRLRPGMFATVQLTTGGASGLLVPVDAVLDSGTEQVVFVAQGEGHFEPRTVRIGKRVGHDVQVVDGLKGDEQVAAGATFFLDSESQLRAAAPGYEAAAGVPTAAPVAGGLLAISVRTIPDPATTGENQFEVSVRDPAGAAVTDADVVIQLFMAGMPTMGMPAMRNEVKLTAAGGGIYRGTGQILMAGRWDATVSVTRAGQRLGSIQLPIVAK
jgi:hypothetical protein